MDKVGVARELATLFHSGQKDKGGHPYTEHLKSVASFVVSEDEKTVAWLHDIVEDTDMTLEQLTEYGFPENIIEAIDAITMREGEDRKTYLLRVAGNELATLVKIADLDNNMDLSRLNPNNITPKDYERANRYYAEKTWLEDVHGE